MINCEFLRNPISSPEFSENFNLPSIQYAIFKFFDVSILSFLKFISNLGSFNKFFESLTIGVVEYSLFDESIINELERVELGLDDEDEVDDEYSLLDEFELADDDEYSLLDEFELVEFVFNGVVETGFTEEEELNVFDFNAVELNGGDFNELISDKVSLIKVSIDKLSLIGASVFKFCVSAEISNLCFFVETKPSIVICSINQYFSFFKCFFVIFKISFLIIQLFVIH